MASPPLEFPTQHLVAEYFASRKVENSPDLLCRGGRSAELRKPNGVRRSFSEDPNQLCQTRHRRPLQDSNSNTEHPHKTWARPLGEVEEEDASETKTVAASTAADAITDSELEVLRSPQQALSSSADTHSSPADNEPNRSLLYRRNGALDPLKMPSRVELQSAQSVGLFSSSASQNGNGDDDADSPRSPCSLVAERLSELGDRAVNNKLIGAGLHELSTIGNIIYSDFARVGRNSFAPQGECMSWKTIAACLLFSFELASLHQEYAQQILEWAARFIVENFVDWVAAQGGWYAVLEGVPTDTEDAGAASGSAADVAPQSPSARSRLRFGGLVLATAAVLFLGIFLMQRR